MVQFVTPLIVALIVSSVANTAWAGSREIGDCENGIKSRLKFPGSYKREYVVRDEETLGISLSSGQFFSTNGLMWFVKIEFTARTSDNSIQRRIGNCNLSYEEGSLFSSKKLKGSSVEIQYE